MVPTGTDFVPRGSNRDPRTTKSRRLDEADEKSMMLFLAVLAVLALAYRLRAKPTAKLNGGLDLDTADLCLEYSDEELSSWGLSREQMRALELKHYDETAYDDSGPDDGRTMRPLRPLYQFPMGRRGNPKVRRPVRHACRSRRAPRRARPSRRARPAARASADPDPAPRRPLRAFLHEGGRP